MGGIPGETVSAAFFVLPFRRGTRMKRGFSARRILAVFLLLVLVCLGMMVLNLCSGSIEIAPGEVLRVLFSRGAEGGAAGSVIFKIRLPRLLAAAVLGGALSVSGYLLQTFFGNPIAGPYVLGISSGAKLFVTVTMVYALGRTTGVPFSAVMAAAFLGSMLVTGLVLLFSGRVRNMAALLVVGIMIGSICTAVTDFFVTFADDSHIANLRDWSMGSFSGVSWPNLTTASLVILIAVVCAFLLAKPISAYRLGENYALSMGVNVRTFRATLIFLSSLLSACVTALSGPISFVGVAVPQLARLLFRTGNPRVLIPGCFLLGGAFCMGCDWVARTAFSPAELSISTVTAVFGAPVVIALMLRRQKEKEHG